MRFPRGTRAGIFEGDLRGDDGAVVAGAGAACCLIVPGLLPVGVFAVERGAGPFITLTGRLCGADLPALAAGFEVWARAGVFDLGGMPFGVFDRAGGAFTSTSSISSRNLSPWIRNGLPYSSSYFCKVLTNSAVTLGRSFAILFLIFSSLSNLPGSRFSPFCGFSISLEASAADAARASRSAMRDLYFSTAARIGARCSFSVVSRSISAS